MIAVVVGLVLTQSVTSQYKQLDAAVAAGRFAEVEQRARKLLSSAEAAEYPAALSRLTRALAEQGKCAATRASLTRSVRDRFLSAQLDTAAGDFEAARVSLAAGVEELLGQTDDGQHVGPSLSKALELLELLTRLNGDEVRAAELDARGLELRAKEVVPEPFDGAVSSFNAALEQKDPARAVKAWTDALTSLEKAVGPRHALVRVALERRAALLQGQGQADAARRDLEHAGELVKSGFCR